MNGVCKSYKMNDPMTWADFKDMPDDLKVSYITALRKRFGCPDKYIAEMMGVGARYLILILKDLGCSAGYGSPKKWDKEGFYAWMSGAEKAVKSCEVEIESEDAVSEAVEEAVSEVEDSLVDIRPDGEAPMCGHEEAESNIGECSNHICKCKSHVMPVIPKRGSMTFEHNDADDALATIKSLLNNMKVNIAISWECVNE